MVVDDRKLTINLSATLVPGEGDEPGGFLILFQDISELENLRDKLARSERLAEIGELSSTVAHEIRNPLSSIRGLAQLLSGKVPEGQGALMDTIVKEVDRLNRVVSGLLSYARQENLHPREWDIGNILPELVPGQGYDHPGPSQPGHERHGGLFSGAESQTVRGCRR
jgi:two-component system sensor histidine kinase HydH